MSHFTTTIKKATLLALFVIISLTIIQSTNFSAVTYAQAQAQSQTNAAYLTYTNFTLGISIQYPSNWIKNQTQNGHIMTYFTPSIDGVSLQLGIDNQPKHLDLEHYLQDSINVFQNSSAWKNFEVLRSGSNYTLAGRPAYEIIGTATDNSTRILREIMEAGTLVGPKVYYHSISTDENVLSYYVPILNRMKDSFSIITPELKQPNNAIYSTVVPNNATSNTVSNNLNNNLNTSFITPLNNNTLASSRNSSSNNNFLTYENSSLGLSIQYPSDWTYYHHHIMIGDETDILFYSPPGPQNETVTLAAGNLPFQNASLSDYSNFIFNRTLSISRLLVGPALQLINSTDTTLGGATMIPAHKITYSINGSYPLVTLATVGGNKGYFMTYDTNPKFQPTIQKMIDSFKIIQNQQQQQKNKSS